MHYKMSEQDQNLRKYREKQKNCYERLMNCYENTDNYDKEEGERVPNCTPHVIDLLHRCASGYPPETRCQKFDEEK